MKNNPYYHRGPIRKSADFYGRDRETTRALQMIQKGQSISVIGPRRIGKTSFLFHLSDPAVRSKYSTPQTELLFAHIDGQLLIGLSSSDILHILLNDITSQTNETAIDTSQVVDYRSFERAIREWSRPGRQLIFLIDEFESLTKNPHWNEDFSGFLRGLASHHNVAYITASEVPLLSLMNEETQFAPFFNFFTPVHLGLFSEEDARRIIQDPSRAAGVDFPQSLEDLIFELAGPHPFFLQIACYYAFELFDEDPRFNKQTYNKLQTQVHADLESHFDFFTSRLTDEQRQALARLLQIGRIDNSNITHSLEHQCLIHQCGETYRFVSRAFAEYLESQLGAAWASSVAEGDRHMVTVLFADVVGFTSLTELHPPEEILSITKSAQRIFVDVVDRHGGKVSNFGGDSVMALFGLPSDQSDDAVRAVRAAIEIQAEIAQLALELELSEQIKFSTRVGLDTGVVVLGEIGGEQRSEYTALGDPVNLAQRMETLAQPGNIVVSEHTFQQIRGWFRTESLGYQRVKGKASPVKAYRVLEEKKG